MFRSYDLWVMSPTRFRCANSLQGHPCRNTTVPMQQTRGLSKNQNKTCGGSGYRSRFSTLRRLYATMYNNPPLTHFTSHHITPPTKGPNNNSPSLQKRMEDPGIDPGSQPCEGCMLPCTTIPRVHPSGLEPEPTPWKGVILPLN